MAGERTHPVLTVPAAGRLRRDVATGLRVACGRLPSAAVPRSLRTRRRVEPPVRPGRRPEVLGSGPDGGPG